MFNDLLPTGHRQVLWSQTVIQIGNSYIIPIVSMQVIILKGIAYNFPPHWRTINMCVSLDGGCVGGPVGGRKICAPCRKYFSLRANWTRAKRAWKSYNTHILCIQYTVTAKNAPL